MSARAQADGSDAIDPLLEALWQDYVRLSPRVARIRALFAADNPGLANDHVALRTFDRAPIGLESLERHFLALGYRRLAPYAFEAKQLDAWSYTPPRPDLPRIFLSALRVDALSADARSIVERLCREIPPERCADAAILHAGAPWTPPTWEEYGLLRAESEYAAWVAALGLHANHFTISVNSLDRPTTIEGVIERVESAGYAMNDAGGKVKGSREALLEQASTLADERVVRFGDGSAHAIPTCYYEFALRHHDARGDLYEGFVAASADRIFESTERADRGA